VSRRIAEVRPPVRPPRPAALARRTRVVVRKVGPWSVLRWSLFFYFCIMLIFFFAMVIVYWILGSVGILAAAAKLAGSLSLGDCSKVVANSQTPCIFEFNGGWIFSRLFIFGVGMVLLWSIVNVLVALLYNLVSDVIGGVELTLVEKR